MPGPDIRLVDIKQAILSSNDNKADEIRSLLRRKKVVMLNVMASPGAGKTSLILETIRRLKGKYRIGVIEGDIESVVDAEKMVAEGVAAVQIRTGGACHLDAPMIDKGLENLALDALDLVFIENIGNLVCPAEFDTGAALRVMILSVPEGDDKVLKYPLMFSVCDVLIINKTDYLPDPGFDVQLLTERVRRLNPGITVFELSCRQKTGVEAWTDWLDRAIQAAQK